MTDKRIRQRAQIISILSAVGAGLVASSVIAVASAAPGVPGNNDRLNNGIVVSVEHAIVEHIDRVALRGGL